MQKVVNNEGVHRFKANAIVRFLLDRGGFSMNDLACMSFADKDRQQFAQLIGYSVCGYAELPYVDDAAFDRALKAEAKMVRQAGCE